MLLLSRENIVGRDWKRVTERVERPDVDGRTVCDTQGRMKGDSVCSIWYVCV